MSLFFAMAHLLSPILGVSARGILCVVHIYLSRSDRVVLFEDILSCAHPFISEMSELQEYQFDGELQISNFRLFWRYGDKVLRTREERRGEPYSPSRVWVVWVGVVFTVRSCAIKQWERAGGVESERRVLL